MRKKYKVSGVGCSLIDNLYHGVDFSAEPFTKYLSRQPGDGGLEPGKLVFTEELEKFAGESFEEILKSITNYKTPDTHNIGGPAIVPLIHLTQMLGKEEIEVCFTGAAGNDRNGLNLMSDLGQTRIDIRNYIQSKKTTPFTDVFTDPAYNNGEGERTFVNNIGAAWDVTPEMLPADFFESDMVVFGGTALVPVIHDNLLTLTKEAKKKGCITIVNTVYDFRNEKINPGKKWPIGETDETYQYIDLLIVDHEEALKLSGKNNLEAAADFFMQSGCEAFIITNGANDVKGFSRGNVFTKSGLITLPVSDKVKHDLSTFTGKGDTTGCGDNFVGGAITSIVMQQLQNNKPEFMDILSWAVVSGGFTCFYPGGTYWENTQGEKASKLEPYFEAYKKQIIT